jgi:hypothetical protein
MKLFLFIVMTSISVSVVCFAQNTDIPVAVKKSFDRIQPNTKVHWDLKNQLNGQIKSFEQLPKSKLLFTGQFQENGSVSAHIFNAKGEYIRKEIGIKPNELPLLTQIYVRSEMKHPISKATRWETLDGSIEYCVTLGQRQYLFSQYGDNLGRLEL